MSVFGIAIDGNDFRLDRSYGLARLNILVEEDPSWLTPVITDPGTIEAVAGEPVEFGFSASRDPAGFTASGLPNGLSLDGKTGEVSGTPTQSGRFEVTVGASNDNGSGVYLFILEIAPSEGAPVALPLPIEKKAIEGTRLELSLEVEDETGTTYQWYKDGSALSGEIFRTIVIDSMDTDSEGDYSVEASNSNGSVLVGSTRVRMIREALFNISTRGYVGIGDEVMIVGFIIRGTQPRRVLIRGLGKSMEARDGNIVDALEDPKLTLYNGARAVVASLDNWTEEANWEEIEAVGLSVGAAPPVDPREAAMLITLDPGLYTAILSGSDGGTGLGLVEVFDASFEPIETRLTNISTRVRASVGQEVAIGGFVITGQDPKRVLIRALGPELLKRDVADVLPDPYMTLYKGSEAVATNDDWTSEGSYRMTEAFAQANATLLDEGSTDAAMVRELQPGLYTVVVNDFNNASGIVLIEVYELP